jgi:hypothetical protein
MDADEREICNYLKGYPGQFIGVSEICRRAAGKRRYREEPNWAVQVLVRLLEKGMVEADSTGHYRLKRKQKDKPQRWMSPHIKKILEESGKKFEDVVEIDEPDADDSSPS